jgi:hypothetical protein
MRKSSDTNVTLAVLKNELLHISQEVQQIREFNEKLEEKFVTKSEFNPIKQGFLIVSGIIFTTVIGAVLKGIII